MPRTFHCHLDVRDAIGWSNHKLRGLLMNEKGECLGPDEARVELRRYLAAGKTCIPVVECDRFDPREGCLGHPGLAAAPTGESESNGE